MGTVSVAGIMAKRLPRGASRFDYSSRTRAAKLARTAPPADAPL